MSSDTDPLPIHSLAEAYLYLMITPCAACGKGQLVADDARAHHDDTRRVLTVPTTCKACQSARDIGFDTNAIEAGGFQPVAPHAIATINPTDDASQIIDVGGWITLATVIAENASQNQDPAESRALKLEAAQCLDEALKFYDDDNDVPPADALRNSHSQRQYKRSPELYSKQRLLDLRAKLPIVQPQSHAPMIDPATSTQPKKRRWWPWSRK